MISYRLSQQPPTDTQRVLQRIIPDIVLNGRGLSDGPLANKKSLADIKTLSPCNKYAEDRTHKPNAVVNARQAKVNQDYHHRAKELDRGFGGDSSDGFDAELNSHGKRGEVLGLVVGAYGEASDAVYLIAEAVAEELATEHCGFYSDKKQGVSLPQSDLPVLGAHRPPRMGAPYARPPVPCRGPERAPPPRRARPRRRRLRRGDRPR